jgi:hypothetical protein
MHLFKPDEGKPYRRDEVVSLCLAYIHSPQFRGNVVEKEQKVAQIKAKSAEYIEFRSRGQGWGRSAMNPNCWAPVHINPGNGLGPLQTKPRAVEAFDGPTVENRIEGPGKLPLNGSVQMKSAADVSEAKYNQRPWQGYYRSELLRIWGACAVTGCRIPSLLTASHIKPVIHCTEEEKTDPYNGILLSKVFDALFDRGFISFQDDGRILISGAIPEYELSTLQVHGDIKILVDQRQFPYLRFHREKIFKGQQ